MTPPRPAGEAPRPRRPRTLLLDLDGTLLDVDMGRFLEGFFRLLARRLAPPGRHRAVADELAASARGMFTSTDPARTLDLVFLEACAPRLAMPVERLRAELAAFHGGEFQRLGRLVRPRAGARELLGRARALGCELVLATNPVFFRAAILARVRWAGLADAPFSLVTAAETMHAAKPHAAYFREVLALAGREPGECLMVGDNPAMDLAAARVGIPTWLAVGDGDDAVPPPGGHRAGTLAELADFLAAGAP